MLDEVKKPHAPQPPSASVRTTTEYNDRTKLPNAAPERITENSTTIKPSGAVFEKPNSSREKIEKSMTEERSSEKVGDKMVNSSTLERRLHSMKVYEKSEGTDALINQLNNRVSI